MDESETKTKQSAGTSSVKLPENDLFKDQRSKRLIFVTHCLLNQNAMIDGLACYPGVVPEVARFLWSSGCGIVQLECPELVYLGLDRKVDLNADRTTGTEDTRVRVLMENRSGRSFSRRLAEPIARQMEQYIRNGFEIVGVLGTNVSPTCGVETTWVNDTEVPGQGVFIQELQQICKEYNLDIPFFGVNLCDPNSVTAISERLSGGSKSVVLVRE